MIKVEIKEYVEDNLVIRTINITFLYIPIFKYKKTSTNKGVISQFTPIKKVKQIGFKYEIEN